MADGTTLQVPAEAGLGDRVRLARVAARKSQRETANALGLSVRVYARIEAGERDLWMSEAHLLSEFTGQDLALFGTPLDDGRRSLPGPLPIGQVEDVGEQRA